MISCRYGVWKIVLWWLGVRVTTLDSMLLYSIHVGLHLVQMAQKKTPCTDLDQLARIPKKNHWCCIDIGSLGAMTLFKETEQGEVFDSTHQGLLYFLGALCPEYVSKDF